MKTFGLVVLGFVMTLAVAFIGYRLIKTQVQPRSTGGVLSPQPTGIVASTIKEFVDKNLTTVCQIPAGENQVYIAMIKGKKVRVNNFKGMEVLIRDGKVYSWKEGSTNGSLQKVESSSLNKEVYEALEKNKNLCLNGDAADFVFELPKEVVFK